MDAKTLLDGIDRLKSLFYEHHNAEPKRKAKLWNDCERKAKKKLTENYREWLEKTDPAKAGQICWDKHSPYDDITRSEAEKLYDIADPSFEDELRKAANAQREIMRQIGLVLVPLQRHFRSLLGNRKSILFCDWLDVQKEYPFGLTNNRVCEAVDTLQMLRAAVAASVKRREPLTQKARLVYEKLSNLKEHEAMTLPEIQDWLLDEHEVNLDDGTFKDLRKELDAYGLQNRPRVGYYLRK